MSRETCRGWMDERMIGGIEIDEYLNIQSYQSSHKFNVQHFHKSISSSSSSSPLHPPHSFIRSFVRSIHSFIHPSIHHSFIHPFIHSFIHSSIHSFFLSFIPSLPKPFQTATSLENTSCVIAP